MTGRERFAAAVAFQETDRPPHFEHMSKLAPETFGRAGLSQREGDRRGFGQGDASGC